MAVRINCGICEEVFYSWNIYESHKEVCHDD